MGPVPSAVSTLTVTKLRVNDRYFFEISLEFQMPYYKRRFFYRKKKSGYGATGAKRQVKQYNAGFREQLLSTMRKNPYSMWMPHYFRR